MIWLKKAKLTVEQGKVLNEELKHNIKQTFKKDEEKDPADVLKGMSPEQIAALKEAIAQKEAADAAQDDERGSTGRSVESVFDSFTGINNRKI